MPDTCLSSYVHTVSGIGGVDTWETCVDFPQGEPCVMNQYSITVNPDYRAFWHNIPIKVCNLGVCPPPGTVEGKHAAYEVM